MFELLCMECAEFTMAEKDFIDCLRRPPLLRCQAHWLNTSPSLINPTCTVVHRFDCRLVRYTSPPKETLINLSGLPEAILKKWPLKRIVWTAVEWGGCSIKAASSLPDTLFGSTWRREKDGTGHSCGQGDHFLPAACSGCFCQCYISEY